MTDCYETDGKIETKETFRVPERLFFLFVNAGVFSLVSGGS